MSNKTETNGDYINVKADLYWARLTKVDPMSGKYGVKLCNLSDAAKEKLWGWGIKKKQVTQDPDHPEYGTYMNCKSQFEIPAVFEDGEPVTDLIGNGSSAIVRLKRRNWTYENVTGVKADVVKITITDFVPIAPKETVEEEAEVF